MIFCFIEGAFIYISNRFWNLLASYQADRKSCRLIQRVCMVEVLLMVFWLSPTNSVTIGLLKLLSLAAILSRTSFAGGLETMMTLSLHRRPP